MASPLQNNFAKSIAKKDAFLKSESAPISASFLNCYLAYWYKMTVDRHIPTLTLRESNGILAVFEGGFSCTIHLTSEIIRPLHPSSH